MKLENLPILAQRTGNIDPVETAWKTADSEKLYFTWIFPHFQWNDLLRFRRVCKDAKKLADKYIKTKGEKLCPEITIYETGTNKDKCLARFLELGFPATSIYIKNTSGTAMFEKEAKNLVKFSEQFGGPSSKITQVRIHQLNSPTMGNEKAFFEGLANLNCLLVDMFGGGVVSDEEPEDFQRKSNENKQNWPDRFKQLKKVTIGVAPNIPHVDAFFGSRGLMEGCSELEYCADAYSSVTQSSIREQNVYVVLGQAFTLIKKYIEDRGKKCGTKSNLKNYDFTCFHTCPATHSKIVEFISSPFFMELLKSCVQHSVKLLNVNSAWLQTWQPSEQYDWHKISTPVVSLVNLHAAVIPMNMPNLEKVTIPATSRCSLVPKLWLEHRKPWEALKVLDVTVDSKMLYTTVISCDQQSGKCVCLDPETTASLMQFLFVGIQREAVREVRLDFVEGVDVEDVTVKAASCLGVCCPNLKKLSLVNWPGTNATVIKVLGNVKALEELCLENCKKIGDLAFIKTDTTDGLVQQHPGLKKLYLKQLDEMPRLTDKLFQDVLSKMKLSHLILSSNKPLTNITPDGIKALKNGQFAKSIEKFPFRGWSLANVIKENFKKMEKEFRSFDMV